MQTPATPATDPAILAQMQVELPPRPTNPADISFDASCFVEGPRREYWLMERAGWGGARQPLAPDQVEIHRKRGRIVHGPYYSAPSAIRIKWK